MDKWYIRNTAGKVFGPAALDALKEWARDGRIEPLAGVSQDLENWMLAPLKPELEMDCVVENNPGQFYGPTHRAVAENLLASGELAQGARLYRDTAAADARIAALSGEMAERDARIAELEGERDAARAEIENLKAEIARRDEELAKREEELARREEVHAREWKTEVLVPEVVSAETPPQVARRVFTTDRAAALADLERRAQQELARMGADRARKFFGMGKK